MIFVFVGKVIDEQSADSKGKANDCCHIANSLVNDTLCRFGRQVKPMQTVYFEVYIRFDTVMDYYKSDY